MGGGGSSDTVQYVLKLERFFVDQTRSGDKDTDVVAFRAIVGDLLYPTQTKRMENIQAGDHLINLEIGPILAPPNTPVSFFYSIINSGYDTSDTNLARMVTDKISDIAADVLKAIFGKDAAWDKLNALTKDINKVSFVNCDGTVVAGGELDEVAIDILEQWTPNGPFQKSEHFQQSTSPALSPPCHGQSDYTVTWSVAAKTAVLDIVGVSSDGHLWHTLRWNDGSWEPFRQLESSDIPITFVDVSNAGSLDDEVHLCEITTDNRIWWHKLGTLATSDLRKLISDPGAFSNVGIATLFGELHVCGITFHDGNIWHTVRHHDGSWQAFGNVKSQTSNPGTFIDVSSAGVAGAGELHICGVTKNGGIWHTIRHVDGSWQSFFGDVTSQAGNPGTFQRVGITSVLNELHVCGITTDGRLWHTIRHADGSWQAFSDVMSQTSNNLGAFLDISSAGVSGELHVCGTTSDGSIWHTIRHNGGGWELFENVTAQAGSQAHFLTVNATEWLQTRRPPQVIISGTFNINVPATDLHTSHPIVSAGTFSFNDFSLRPPLKIQWSGGQGTTISNPTGSSISVDCDMKGNTEVGGGQDFQISVQVTDRLGVSVSDQKTISINVIGNKGG